MIFGLVLRVSKGVRLWGENPIAAPWGMWWTLQMMRESPGTFVCAYAQQRARAMRGDVLRVLRMCRSTIQDWEVPPHQSIDRYAMPVTADTTQPLSSVTLSATPKIRS